MRFAHTDEQVEFAAAVRSLLDEVCDPTALRRAWEADRAVDTDRWRKLGDMGLLGIAVPAKHGGLGLGELDWVLLLEETGRAALPEPIVEHAAVAAPLLAAVGSAELCERWLPAMAAGDVVVSVQSQGKPHLLAADDVDLAILVRGDEVHAVPRDRFSVVAQTSVDGARRVAEVDWRHRSDDTLLLSGPEGYRTINRAFDRGALATAAQLLGLADRMIAMTVEYVKARHQFGVPVGSFQAVKHQLADAYLRLEFARPVVHGAAWSMAHLLPERSRDVSMAKAYASEAAWRAGRVALQCHGAIGYTVEYDLHLYLKRAWALAAQWGDAAWHRRRVALAVLGPEPLPHADPDATGLLGETLG